ncbi:MAG: hypothetical protein OXM56_10370 [Gammaproteobacteria bacterium]|nr:hypothetical protein [Gammaproteobacteria bacterium]
MAGSEQSGETGASGGLLSGAGARKAVTVLTVGLVSGVSLLIGEIALATLVFSGDLAPYLSQASACCCSASSPDAW